MDNEKFNKCVSDQIKKCEDMLIKKSDYGADTDRLHNFQAFSDLAGISVEQACGGYLGKHLVSIYDLIKNGSENLEVWDEKITDAINYLLILSAIIRRDQFEKHKDIFEDHPWPKWNARMSKVLAGDAEQLLSASDSDNITANHATKEGIK